jgi:Uma2 family endonuclease
MPTEQSMSTTIEQTRSNWQGVEMSVEEFLTLPDDGMHRELVCGKVREFGMTTRNRFHSRIVIRIGQLLANWMDLQPEPRGEVVGGEAGFWLKGTKESLVGIDVAVVAAELVAATGPKDKLFHGAPVLAVEILSPSDTHEDIVEMVKFYLAVGTVVWVVDPDFETVAVHRPGRKPETFHLQQELLGEPYLPGFRASVAAFFA